MKYENKENSATAKQNISKTKFVVKFEVNIPKRFSYCIDKVQELLWLQYKYGISTP